MGVFNLLSTAFAAASALRLVKPALIAATSAYYFGTGPLGLVSAAVVWWMI